MAKLYLIDGNAYIHRAFHALPPLTTSRGQEVGAVYGFIRLLLKIINRDKPDYIAVAFDSPGETRRHQLFSAYKINRPATPDSLRSQIPLAIRGAQLLGLAVFQEAGQEADDLIAAIVDKFRLDKKLEEIIIVSGDKDILQLVQDESPAVRVLNVQKDVLYDCQKVREKYGIGPAQFGDYLALIGDASDNIPGVKGIGPVTAAKLLDEYKTIEGIYQNLEKISPAIRERLIAGQNFLPISRQLVRLKTDGNVVADLPAYQRQPPGREEVINFLKEMEFGSLLKEFLPEPDTENSRNEVADDIVPITPANIDELVEPIKAAGRIIIVAYGLTENKILGMGLRFGGRSVYLAAGWEKLAGIFADEKIKKVGHDLKLLGRSLSEQGIDFRGIDFDTMIAAYCLNPGKNFSRLAEVALEYLNEPIGEPNAQRAGRDLLVIEKLQNKLVDQLRAQNLDNYFSQVEIPLSTVLLEMERYGILIDRPYLQQLVNSFQDKITQLEKDIYQIAGTEFNLNSPKQLSFILFEKLQLPPQRKTKTGYSTDEEVLRKLAMVHELPARLLEYRHLQKLVSTYGVSLLNLVDSRTGRIHTTFNQAITATGRLSSSDPNLQNIPIRSEYGRQIRRAFIAPDEKLLLSADYSQIDLRVLAHLSGDEKLLKAFLNNEDIHNATAREIFGEITPQQRRLAKTINFGIIYGMSPHGLAQELNIDQKSARDYIENYFSRYCGVKKYLDNCLGLARQQGYVTTILGRRRYLPEINSANGQLRQAAERIALNTPIQGTAADIIKIAMIDIARGLAGSDSHLLVQVHDELVLEVPRKEIEKVAEMVREKMTAAIKLKVPLVVDLKYGQNWAEMEKWQ